MSSIVRTWAAWLGLAAACAALAAAGQDLPTRVGRVAFVEGSVSLFQDPDFGWDAASLNSPVTTQNSLWTEASSRAEVRVGSLALRLDELTQLDIAHLDDDGIEAGVARGGLAIRVRHYDGHEGYRFYTPQAQFRLLADGRYRIDSDPERESTRLTVLAGSAVLESTQGDVRVPAGKAIVVGDGLYALEAARAGNLDRWADSRDADWVERNVTRYVPTDITGYEELDRYGTWVDDPSYGALWMPTSVAADWVPYRHGHWAWVRPWGWTWIDEAPWGYAPFHYGRWVQARGRWAWYPGPRTDRQAWAPALVGWIGGTNFNVTVRSGGSAPALGWYPLAPDERFQPWYQANTAYVNRVNVIVRGDGRSRDRNDRNNRNDRNATAPREWNREHGATVVPRDTLLRQRPVAQNVVSMAPQVVRQHETVPQPSTVLPSRNELSRERPAQARPAQAPSSSGTREQRGGAPTPAPPVNPFARGERPKPQRPSQARPGQQEVPRPAPPGTPAPAARGNPAPQSAPAAPPAVNPFARAPARDERQQQPQQQQQRDQQQQQERAAREGQQRAAEQQRQQQQQQQQAQQRGAEQQRQQQERSAREAQQRTAEQQRQQQQQVQQRAAEQQQQQQQQQAQQRAAEQQRQQQQQQQQQAQQRADQQRQQQQQAQQRAAEQQRQQQQAQQRAAEQQRQQQQQQQAQQRAAEQQRQQQQEQQAQQRAAEQQRQQQQQQQAQQRAAEQQRQQQQQQQAQQRAAEQQRQQQQQQQQAQQRAAEQQQRQQQQAAERQQREQAQQQQRAQQQQQREQAQQQQQQQRAAPQHPAEKPEHEPRGKEKDDHGSGG